MAIRAKIGERKKWSIKIGVANGGVRSHDKLLNRDAGNQHPISSISGLAEKLEQLFSHSSKTGNVHNATAADVGARPNTWMPTAKDVGARPSNWIPTAEEVGARPSDWVPSAEEVGARADTWLPTITEIGAAPAGFGFGDRMTYVDLSSDAYKNMTFDEALDSVLATMPGYSAAQIQCYEPNGEVANKYMGYLWKYTPNYATLISISYNCHKRVKCKRSGAWQEPEWDNPPMQPGVEYRTTERHGGKVVYRKRITYTNAETIGKASGVSTTLVPHNISNLGECVCVTARQTGSVLPYITTSGGLAVAATVTAASVILTFKDCTWSSREWEFDVAYTKNT